MIRNLRIERIKRGLSLSAVGKIVGTTKQSLSSLETGKTKFPSYHIIVELEKLFRARHHYLLATHNDDAMTTVLDVVNSNINEGGTNND